MKVNREKPFRRAILSRGASFWAVAAIGLLALLRTPRHRPCTGSISSSSGSRGGSAIRGSRAAGRCRGPDLRNRQRGPARPAAREQYHTGRFQRGADRRSGPWGNRRQRVWPNTRHRPPTWFGWLLVAAFIIGIVALLGMPEPGTVRAGVVSSLRPRVTVPHGARGAFAAALPALGGSVGTPGF